MKFTQFFNLGRKSVYHPGVRLQNIIWYTGLLKMMKTWNDEMMKTIHARQEKKLFDETFSERGFGKNYSRNYGVTWILSVIHNFSSIMVTFLGITWLLTSNGQLFTFFSTIKTMIGCTNVKVSNTKSFFQMYGIANNTLD